MKKVIGLLLVCFMALGAVKAFADTRSDSLNIDSRFIDDVDNIFYYPNLVTDFKNMADTRTNYLGANGTWGGVLDGEHTGMGVIGAYVFRPFTYGGGRTWNYNAPGWHSPGVGWFNGGFNQFAANYPGSYTGHFAPATPENKVDLFWGNNFGNANFGVQINYADAEGRDAGPFFGGTGDHTNSNNVAAAGDASQTTASDSRVLGLNAGLGLQDAGPFSALNIHAGYYMGSVNDSELNVRNAAGANTGTTENNTLKDNGISTITLGALANAKIDDNSSMRLFLDAYIDSNGQVEHLTRVDNTQGAPHTSALDRDETYGGKDSDIVANLGLGCNHKVLDGKATISMGLQTTWVNATRTNNPYVSQDGNTANTTTTNGSTVGYDSATWDIWDLDWNGSVEAKIASWLTARAGINRPIIWRTGVTTTTNTYAANAITSTAKTSTNGDSYFGGNGSTYSMGVGIDFENWTLDLNATVGDVYQSFGNVSPGNGLIFQNNITNNNGFTGTLFSAYDADVRFRF